MSRSMKLLFIITGLVSLVVLGWTFFSTGKSAPAPDVTEHYETPEHELRFYLDEPMNLELPFSRLLARKRIERARVIAAENPETSELARTVIDSIERRLGRNRE